MKMDYYALLGVPATASQKEIQLAYRLLAKKYHPDRLRQDSAQVQRQGEERLKQINIAYATLSHSAKRQGYDRLNGYQFRTRSQPGRHTSRRRQNACSGKDEYSRTAFEQNLARARRKYRNCTEALSVLEKQILARLFQLIKTVGLVGFGSSLGVALLFFILGILLESAVIAARFWRNALLMTLLVTVIQGSAILVVSEQLQISLPRGQRFVGLFIIWAMVITNSIIASLFTRLTVQDQAPVWGPFVHAFAIHLISCLHLSREWLKPQLQRRHRLKARLATTEDVMKYFRSMLEEEWGG